MMPTVFVVKINGNGGGLFLGFIGIIINVTCDVSTNKVIFIAYVCIISI